MARGYDGAFGRKINNPWIWGGLCLVFFLGLANLRQPLSVRNLDLLVLLSFGISLYFFNQGEVFTAMPLAYPPLLYLLGPHGLDRRGRAAGRPGSAALADLAAAGRDGLPRRLPLRHEPARVERDRRRARRRHRRAADRRGRRDAVREHAGRRGRGVRRGRRGRLRPRADPDERPLRGGERARRHVRAGRLPRLRPRLRDDGLRLRVGLPARRPLHVAPLGRAGADRAGGARLPLRRRCAWGRRSPSRGRPTRSRSTSPTRTRTTRSCPRS